MRDFYGVFADVRPDEAWILTCNDFTRDARKFAKAMGIRLATLRAFGARDWESRIRTAIANIRIQRVDGEHPTITLVMDEADLAMLKAEAEARNGRTSFTPENDRTAVFDGEKVRPLSEIILDIASRVPLDFEGSRYGEGIEFEGWISVNAGRQYSIHGIRVDVPVTHERLEVRVTAVQEAARLLLTDGQGLDFVLWEDALAGYTIDEAGEVHLSDETTQKRLINNVTRST